MGSTLHSCPVPPSQHPAPQGTRHHNCEFLGCPHSHSSVPTSSVASPGLPTGSCGVKQGLGCAPSPQPCPTPRRRAEGSQDPSGTPEAGRFAPPGEVGSTQGVLGPGHSSGWGIPLLTASRGNATVINMCRKRPTHPEAKGKPRGELQPPTAEGRDPGTPPSRPGWALPGGPSGTGASV